MCGIAGIVPRSNSGLLYAKHLKAMLSQLEHRGPDATYLHASPQVAFGMTRLSIVGGDDGVQPIWNETNTCAVVCNGEIYNYKSLRAMLELHGHEFRTSSDVEVIVHLYEEYGEKCLSQLEGIFALCLWDTERQRMVIARDRIGVKPLYYVNTDEAFFCASELRALLPAVNPKLSMSAFSSYHELRFAPAPYTLVEGIEKLPPAHYAVVQGRHLRIQGYWSPGLSVLSPSDNGRMRQERVKHLIEEAVSAQQAEGVSSGVLLSGGLDSTLLVALQTKLFGAAPDTITVSFKQPEHLGTTTETEYDEHSYARQVADLFGCKHHVQEFGADETWDLLPQIIADLDEPIADPTALPLWFASRVAHQAGHRVLFSGEGMDELFAGYSLYRQTYWLRALQMLPRGLRRGLQGVLKDANLPGSHLLSHSLQSVTNWYRSIGELFTDAEMNTILREPIRRATRGAEQHWSNNTITRFLHLREHARANQDPLQQMLLFDCVHWLPENTLTKSDKISMAHSVELRVPFLNERLFEYALALPARDKLRRGVHKYIVRNAFRDLIPSDVMNRPKAGFPVPITAWTFGEWHERIHQLLLSPESLTRDIYHEDAILNLLASPPAAQRRAARLLWSLITMELWLKSLTAQTEIGSIDEFVGVAERADQSRYSSVSSAVATQG